MTITIKGLGLNISCILTEFAKGHDVDLPFYKIYQALLLSDHVPESAYEGLREKGLGPDSSLLDRYAHAVYFDDKAEMLQIENEEDFLFEDLLELAKSFADRMEFFLRNECVRKTISTYERLTELLGCRLFLMEFLFQYEDMRSLGRRSLDLLSHRFGEEVWMHFKPDFIYDIIAYFKACGDDTGAIDAFLLEEGGRFICDPGSLSMLINRLPEHFRFFVTHRVITPYIEKTSQLAILKSIVLGERGPDILLGHLSDIHRLIFYLKLFPQHSGFFIEQPAVVLLIDSIYVLLEVLDQLKEKELAERLLSKLNLSDYIHRGSDVISLIESQPLVADYLLNCHSIIEKINNYHDVRRILCACPGAANILLSHERLCQITLSLRNIYDVITMEKSFALEILRIPNVQAWIYKITGTSGPVAALPDTMLRLLALKAPGVALGVREKNQVLSIWPELVSVLYDADCMQPLFEDLSVLISVVRVNPGLICTDSYLISPVQRDQDLLDVLSELVKQSDNPSSDLIEAIYNVMRYQPELPALIERFYDAIMSGRIKIERLDAEQLFVLAEIVNPALLSGLSGICDYDYFAQVIRLYDRAFEALDEVNPLRICILESFSKLKFYLNSMRDLMLLNDCQGQSEGKYEEGEHESELEIDGLDILDIKNIERFLSILNERETAFIYQVEGFSSDSTQAVVTRFFFRSYQDDVSRRMQLDSEAEMLKACGDQEAFDSRFGLVVVARS